MTRIGEEMLCGGSSNGRRVWSGRERRYANLGPGDAAERKKHRATDEEFGGALTLPTGPDTSSDMGREG